ncbi:MAG: hypothetical protein IJJ98_01590 [Prevotella sp.]|nr:hypothetical protein [Prevotella sp.]MBR0525371.1 hypothetical protein [Prevotella sp.]
MEPIHHYINLSWAVVGICERPRVGDPRSGMNVHQPLLSHIPGIDKDEAAAVEHYVIGYMAFWHIAFVDEDRLVPCDDDALRNEARQKIDRYIADHPPVETFPRFYLVLLRQPIAPMEPDGMSRVYQM